MQTNARGFSVMENFSRFFQGLKNCRFCWTEKGGDKMKLLIVEDEFMLADVIKDRLEEEDFEVDLA